MYLLYNLLDIIHRRSKRNSNNKVIFEGIIEKEALVHNDSD